MAEEYKSNSHRSKEQAHESMEDKKIEKVVTGTVKQRKKTGLSRAASTFMPGDVDSVKSYMLMDVLVPSIKRAISDIVCNGINMLRIKPNYVSSTSEEYWTGWAVAFYQWQRGLSCDHLVRHVPISQIAQLYKAYHEVDIRQFCDKVDSLYQLSAG